MHSPATRPRFRDLPSPIPPHPGDAAITSERARNYRQVLARRFSRLAVVVEDCVDPHNASAIVRTCDAFGLHTVAVVTGRNSFRLNPKICQGSHRYLDLRIHAKIEECYAQLRAEGYRILVSDLAADAVAGPGLLKDTLAAQPLALVFGNEGSGVTPAAVAGADGCFLIPMVGFPQSLNLSVSVATTIYALRGAALEADAPGDLTPEAQRAWYERWLKGHAGPAVEALMAAGGPAPGEDRHGEAVEAWRA